MYHNAYRIWNAVIDTEELCTICAQLYLISRRNYIDRYLIKQLMLFQFDIDQTLCQTRCVNGGEVKHRQYIRKTPNMIFMAVSNKNTTYTILLISEVARIWN